MQATDLVAQSDVTKVLGELEVTFHGFAYVGDIVSPKFKSLPFAITIGLSLSTTVVDNIIAGPNQAYYDEYISVNSKLDVITEHLKSEIERKGYRAYAIPSSKLTDFVNIKGEFPHKVAAVRGGLGWIGKSSLLVTKKYGPRVRLATVLTDLPFQTSEFLEKNYCRKCKKCADACPAGAILGNLWEQGVSREQLIDVKKCDLWITNNYSQFSGLICGICIAVCPHGSNNHIDKI